MRLLFAVEMTRTLTLLLGVTSMLGVKAACGAIVVTPTDVASHVQASGRQAAGLIDIETGVVNIGSVVGTATALASSQSGDALLVYGEQDADMAAALLRLVLEVDLDAAIEVALLDVYTLRPFRGLVNLNNEPQTGFQLASHMLYGWNHPSRGEPYSQFHSLALLGTSVLFDDPFYGMDFNYAAALSPSWYFEPPQFSSFGSSWSAFNSDGFGGRFGLGNSASGGGSADDSPFPTADGKDAELPAWISWLLGLPQKIGLVLFIVLLAIMIKVVTWVIPDSDAKG